MNFHKTDTIIVTYPLCGSLDGQTHMSSTSENYIPTEAICVSLTMDIRCRPCKALVVQRRFHWPFLSWKVLLQLRCRSLSVCSSPVFPDGGNTRLRKFFQDRSSISRTALGYSPYTR